MNSNLSPIDFPGIVQLLITRTKSAQTEDTGFDGKLEENK